MTATTIRCGNCKQTHATVAEVRECFGKVSEPTATPGQINFCHTLLRERVPPDKYSGMSEDRINSFSKDEASAFITDMKRAPFRRPKTEALPLPHPEVPEGYYALWGKDGAVDFYKLVDWKDARLLFHVYGSPGSLEERRVKRHELAVEVMNAIAADPAAASTLFGRELKTCGVCGSPLTKEESRAAGIGPICAGKMRW